VIVHNDDPSLPVLAFKPASGAPPRSAQSRK
jgi:hypothetical protein